MQVSTNLISTESYTVCLNGVAYCLRYGVPTSEPPPQWAYDALIHCLGVQEYFPGDPLPHWAFDPTAKPTNPSVGMDGSEPPFVPAI